ncbi:alpha/beta fold hydrolase [Kribbella sp. GL6]|uniref:alpha/beta fold hydrolase n=1 Tax=Kribbella sp. GL6 TaxID=3419765 RepID=UPI003D0885B1
MLKLLAVGLLTTNVLTPPAPTLTWGACPGGPGSVGIECATLQIPVDWDHPNGRRLTLTIGRLRSTAAKPKGSVLVNLGGPVGISIDLMRKYGGGESFAGLRQKMDIVTWDLRGGPNTPGLSTNLPCDWTGARIPALPRNQKEFDRLAATNRAAAERCRAKDPELFGAMDSATHARDADAIRQALGEQQTSFYGASYGGFIGQAYARLFPQRVRAMALDGTWNHSAANWNKELPLLARDVQSYVIRFFDWCRTQGDCPNAPALWQRAMARAPLPAGQVTYSGDDIRYQAVALARNVSYPRLAAALKKAATTGDASGFVPDPPNAPYAMTASPGVVECTDWPHPADQRQLEQQVRRCTARPRRTPVRWRRSSRRCCPASAGRFRSATRRRRCRTGCRRC